MCSSPTWSNAARPATATRCPTSWLPAASYLDRQIEAINPRIIVTLGRYSMAKFMPNVKISEVHGQPFWHRGRMIVPMFHPAAALHQPSLKTGVERDFSRLGELIQQARQSVRAGSPESRSCYAPAGRQA